jgi:hypothetical protein
VTNWQGGDDGIARTGWVIAGLVLLLPEPVIWTVIWIWKHLL